MKGIAAFNQIFCLLMLLTVAAAQQETVPTTSPIEDHGVYAINLQNLNIILQNNIRKKAGLIPISASTSGAVNWFVGAQGLGSVHIGTVGSYSLSTPSVGQLGTGVISTKSPLEICSPGNNYYAYTQFYVVTADGSAHKLTNSGNITVPTVGSTCAGNSSLTANTVDGTGITLNVNVVGQSLVSTLTYLDGTVLTLNTGIYQKDSNGNTLSVAFPAGSYTDSLGTNVLNKQTSAPWGFWWKDALNGTQKITETLTTYTVATNYGCPSPNLDSPGFFQQFATQIQFADGSLENLTYEQTPGQASNFKTGRLTNITLPTGGNVAFGYTGAFQCAYLEPTTMTRTTTDGQWKYTWAPLLNAGVWYGNTTTVTDPAGNTTVYTFNGVRPTNFWSFFEPVLAKVVVNQGVSTPIVTKTICYNANTICTGPTAPAVSLPFTQIDTYTLLAGMSGSSLQTETFDNVFGALKLSSKSQDFSPSTTSLSTTYTYGSWNTGTGSCAPTSSTILSTVCRLVVTDAAGNNLSETRTTYDGFGNPTNHYAWTGSKFLASSSTYNPTGTPATTTAVNGTVTTYTYGACNGGFPTVMAVGGLTVSSAWDCSGGIKISDTDANSQITQYSSVSAAGSADPYWRTQQTTDPLLNVTNTAYTPNTKEVSFSFGTSLEDAIDTVDGYGRTVRSQKKHGALYDTVTTAYGYTTGVGAYVSTSVPCAVAFGADCTVGFSTKTVDGDSRLYSLVDGGGATAAYTYLKNDSTVSLGPAPAGEHAKVSQTEIDGLGRTISTCGILSTGGSPCGQASGGSGIATLWSFTTASGTSTTTATRGVQTKVVVKDALNRIVSSASPERGTVTSSYDIQAACAGSVDGYLTTTVDAKGNNLCRYYDAIGRVTLVSANGNNCRGFYYDSSRGFTGAFPTGIAPVNTLGRLVEAVTTNCSSTLLTTEWFSYSPRGELTDVWESTPHSGGYYHTTVNHAPNGTPISLTGIPGYPAIAYTVDADGKLSTAIDGAKTVVSGVTYGSVGALSVSIGSGTDEDAYLYDSTTGRMKQYQFFVGANNSKGVLTWNTDGTLGSLVVTDGFNAGGSQTCSFAYDDVSRLVSDSCTGAPWSQTFTYDQYDNLTKSGSATWAPGYSAINNRYTGIGATYDANGNLTYDSFNHYNWDGFNKMSTVTTTTTTCGSVGTCVWYDAFGRAAEVSTGSVYVQMLYSPLGKTALMQGQTTVSSYKPLPGGGTLYSTGSNGLTNEYWHKDWLGSVRVESAVPTSGNGAVGYDRGFAPYGEMYANFGYNNVLNFTGDTQDTFPGLFDTPNRELTSEGRWLSPDPAGFGWNLYAYSTNPNSETDPTGLFNSFWAQGEMYHQMDGNTTEIGQNWAEFNTFTPVPADQSVSVLQDAEPPDSPLNLRGGDTYGLSLLPGSGCGISISCWLKKLLSDSGVPDNLVSAAAEVPWSFNFIASTPEEPIGPAITVAYNPKTRMLFVGGGAGASEGHNASFGPLVPLPGTKTVPDDVLNGGSISVGGNLPNGLGVTATTNSSGTLVGPTYGIMGGSVQATYSWGINLGHLEDQVSEFLDNYW